MDVIRAFGLVFFMTILVAGCIAAVSVSPPNPPPISQSPRVVSWSAAVSFLQRGQVISVAQTHNLTVYLFLKDGTRLVTSEPELDAIFVEIERCGQPCNGILMATQ